MSEDVQIKPEAPAETGQGTVPGGRLALGHDAGGARSVR